MNTYIVYVDHDAGYGYEFEVEAESMEDAIDKAYEQNGYVDIGPVYVELVED
jgi:hypothetical protein